MKPNDERKIIIILSALKHRVVKFTVSMLWAEKSEIHVDLLHSAFVNFIIIRRPGANILNTRICNTDFQECMEC